jgi:hypothetical protein
LDFGLAKILEPENFQVRPEATAAGLVLCTARYAAPDLLKGSPSAQSDIYALGISMIEMLDGRPPYGGDDFYTVAAKHIDPAPVPMGAASSGSVLASFIETCTEKNLDLRYASAADAIADLVEIQRRLIAAQGSAYRDTVSASVMARFGGPTPTRPMVRRRRRNAGIVLGVAAIVVALGVTAAVLLTGGEEPTPAEPAEVAVTAAESASARRDDEERRARRRDTARTRERADDDGDADDSPSAPESDTDENLFGGIRTIGGQ